MSETVNFTGYHVLKGVFCNSIKFDMVKKGSVMSFCTQIAPFPLSCTIYYQRTTNSNGNMYLITVQYCLKVTLPT